MTVYFFLIHPVDESGFVGKGSVVFWGEAGEGCTLRKEA